MAQNQVKLGLFSLSSAAPQIRCAILARVNTYSFHCSIDPKQCQAKSTIFSEYFTPAVSSSEAMQSQRWNFVYQSSAF